MRPRETEARAPFSGLDAYVEALVTAKVREALKVAQGPDLDPWVVVFVYLALTRREAAELCREGKIEGAVKHAKCWRARRSACDAAMLRIGVAPPARTNDAEPEDVEEDDILAAAGLVLVPATPAKRTAKAVSK